MAVLAITAIAVLSVLINGDGRVQVRPAACRRLEPGVPRDRDRPQPVQHLVERRPAGGERRHADEPQPLAGTGPSVVDGTPYTVVREVQWLPVGNGASACDGGSLVDFPSLRVQVRVTWPDMGSAKPVRSDTLLTPSKDTLGNTVLSFVAVKVKNAAGLGVRRRPGRRPPARAAPSPRPPTPAGARSSRWDRPAPTRSR